MTLRLMVFIQNQVVNNETLERVNVEELRFRIEARRHPIGCTLFVGANQRAISLRLFLLIRNGLTLCVEPRSPVRRYKWCGEQMFPCSSIEEKKIAIPAGLRR